MPAVLRRPTLVIGMGRLGDTVVARLDEEATALSSEDRSRFATITLPSPAFHAELSQRLEQMLRAGADRTPQLDVALLADTSEVHGHDIVGVAEAVSQVLASAFGVMFPPSLVASQRMVWLNVVLSTPPLTDTIPGRDAIDTCSLLEKWHRDGPPSPCLARVWLSPRQTASGVLRADDVVSSVLLFVTAAYLSGARDSDALRTRLGHPRDPDRLVASFAVAAADVPVGRLLEYCTWRTALAGLENLAAQADRAEPSPADVDAAMGPLHADTWLAPIETDALAKRAAAVPRPRSTEHPPRLWESGKSVLARYPDLLKTGDRREAPPDESDPAIKTADQQETGVLETARKDLQAFVEERLSPANGLRDLTLLRRGIERAAERFEQIATAALAQGPRLAPRSTGAEHALTRLRAAAETKAGATSVLGLTLPLGTVLSIAAAGLFAAFGSPVQGASVLEVLVPGVVLGMSSAAAWAIGSQQLARRALAAAIDDRRREIASAGGSADAIRTAEASKQVRRGRTARNLARVLRAELERLNAVRAALEVSIQRARSELTALHVQSGESPRDDNTADLLPAATPLHWLLLPASAAPTLCSKSRETQDDSIWSARLLEVAWPSDGIETDLPFADPDRWISLSRSQHELLRERSPFAWPDVGATIETTVTELLMAAPTSLALGIRPLRENGDRDIPAGEGELVGLAPPDATGIVERVRKSGMVPRLTLCEAHAASPRLVVLTTATEIDSASLRRGLS